MALPTPARLASLFTLAAVLGLTAACGSDEPSVSSATSGPATTSAGTAAPATSGGGTTTPAGSTPVTASAELCAQRDALESSIDDLKDINIVQAGASGVQDALTKVKDDLVGVEQAAGEDLKPQVQEFKDALSNLETAIKDIGSGGAAAAVTALQEVGTTGSTLLTSLQSLKCP
jgi:hypothetical protein